jgi:hypothetical protein
MEGREVTLTYKRRKTFRNRLDLIEEITFYYIHLFPISKKPFPRGDACVKIYGRLYKGRLENRRNLRERSRLIDRVIVICTTDDDSTVVCVLFDSRDAKQLTLERTHAR